MLNLGYNALMQRAVLSVIVSLTLLPVAPALAQLKKTRATLRVDLGREAQKYRPGRPKKIISIKQGDFKGLYGYKAAATRAMLPLRDEIIRCVNVQRFTNNREFSERLDFTILPDGKLKEFRVRRNESMRACLLPHLTRIKWPRFKGRKQYTHQVIIASPRYRIGRRTKARSLEPYPVGDRTEERAYRMAAGWVLQPWTGGMGDCAEYVDQSMGAGYVIWFEMGIDPKGRARYLEMSVEGEQAEVALKRLAPCAVPLARGLRAPRHKGKGLFRFRSGTRTASWERD